MTPALLLLLHGGDDRVDLIYFWSSLLIVILPVTVFVTMGVLAVRAYRRRQVADGGGEPPPQGDRSPAALKAITKS